MNRYDDLAPTRYPVDWDEDERATGHERTYRPAARSSTASPARGRVKGRYYSEPLVERFAPAWGKRAALSISQVRAPGFRGLILLLVALLFGFGLALMVGGAYTSIQGLRIPLQLMGLPVETTGIPALQWWLWPLSLTFVELVAKRLDGLRLFWWSAYVVDGATTAFFLSRALTNLADRLGYAPGEPLLRAALIGGISALGGLILAVLAEQIFLSSLCMLRALSQRRG